MLPFLRDTGTCRGAWGWEPNVCPNGIPDTGPGTKLDFGILDTQHLVSSRRSFTRLPARLGAPGGRRTEKRYESSEYTIGGGGAI